MLIKCRGLNLLSFCLITPLSIWWNNDYAATNNDDAACLINAANVGQGLCKLTHWLTWHIYNIFYFLIRELINWKNNI